MCRWWVVDYFMVLEMEVGWAGEIALFTATVEHESRRGEVIPRCLCIVQFCESSSS